MRLTLYAVVRNVAAAMERLAPEGRLDGPGAFQIETGVELVCHADTAVHLDHVVGHVVQEFSGFALRQRAQNRGFRITRIDGAQRRLNAGTGELHVHEQSCSSMAKALEGAD